MVKRSDQMAKGTLEITNDIMKIGSDIYRINNLVRVGKFEKKSENGGLIFLLLLAILGTFFLGSQEPQIVPVGIGAIIFLGFILSLRKSKYALHLETNSGSGQILWSKKEEDIDSLIELISSVMRAGSKEVKYTVNMNDYSVRDIVMGDKFKSIKDAVIATRGSISQRG
jgi:hypothetical protein